MLQVSKISNDFGGLRALDDVSFVVREGEVVGLIGPNGSGKSTAFNVITGFLAATSGSVTFCGEEITRQPAHQVARRGLARTFQLVRPFLHLTTLNNVLAGCLFGHAQMPSKKSAESRAYHVLEQVGLTDKAQVAARNLTVMERKWLEVARALAGEPKLLLLDEPALSLFIRAPDVPTWLDLGSVGDYVLLAPGWHNAVQFEGVDELNAKHVEREGRPSDPIVGPSYAAVQILADAIERTGSLDREAIRDAIAATDMETVSGPITFHASRRSQPYYRRFMLCQKSTHRSVPTTSAVCSGHPPC